ncbi:MAG TPA: hypothetical protein VMH22_05995 [bacterium]|nr:hypothetical protein [bacterium]
MLVTKFIRRLLHDTRGQVLWLGVVLAVALLAFMLAMSVGTRAVTQKVRVQNAVDAGAYTGSVWLARSLNLCTNMNEGIRSVYTWMTVLTVSEALARTLYADTDDASVKATGQNITSALFGNSNPVSVHSNEYAGSVRKLDTTAQWLYSLQNSIATSFQSIAASAGTQAACQNMHAYPASQSAGGRAIVTTNDTTPLLVASASGDSLVYAEICRCGQVLNSIPTLDVNITNACGRVVIDSSTWNVRAYCSDTSNWFDRVDTLDRDCQYAVYQTFQRYVHQGWQWYTYTDTVMECRANYGWWQNWYLNGDSWGSTVVYCGEPDGHTPITWPNGKPTPPYKNSPTWQFISARTDNNWTHHHHWMRDTIFCCHHCALRSDTYAMRNWICHSESSCLSQRHDTIHCHYWKPTGCYTGAESTCGLVGTKVRPRQVNPNREFNTIAYVWYQGATTSPYGLGPALGGKLFPRSKVAAPSPLFAVARSTPYLSYESCYVMQVFTQIISCHGTDTAYKHFPSTGGSTWNSYMRGDSWIAPYTPSTWNLAHCDSGTAPCTQEVHFFAPFWDVELNPLDSAGIALMMSDTAYAGHTHNCFSNLQNLRKYALLP